MTLNFESRTLCFDTDGNLVGEIESHDHTAIDGRPMAFCFCAEAEIHLTSEELRAIADKLDELNGVVQK